MYDFVAGNLVSLADDTAVIDVGGLGYRLKIPTSTRKALEGRSHAHLYAALRLRDEKFQLYGFATLEERRIFERVCTIAGIGPGIALAILSGIPIEEFREAVRVGHVKVLERIKGIGRKTAQRLILELREVLADEREAAGREWPAVGDDAVAALIAVGHGQGEAEQAVAAALQDLPDSTPLEELVKRALREART